MRKKAAEASADLSATQWQGSRDLVTIRHGRVLLVLRENSCGKANCHRCPHGPYWYLVYFRKGKPRTEYIGKSMRSERAQRNALVASVCDEAMRTRGVPAVAEEAYGAWLRGARWMEGLDHV